VSRRGDAYSRPQRKRLKSDTGKWPSPHKSKAARKAAVRRSGYRPAR